jgi:hypothetical protein
VQRCPGMRMVEACRLAREASQDWLCGWVCTGRHVSVPEPPDASQRHRSGQEGGQGTRRVLCHGPAQRHGHCMSPSRCPTPPTAGSIDRRVHSVSCRAADSDSSRAHCTSAPRSCPRSTCLTSSWLDGPGSTRSSSTSTADWPSHGQISPAILRGRLGHSKSSAVDIKEKREGRSSPLHPPSLM